jgi:NAD(P)H-hydrate repair Nnr-like enzyme with NAD(P)H-hydrate epimerase domain
MRKDSFYRCIRNSRSEVVADKISGFSEGNIGIYDIHGICWIAVWIPTGLKIAEGQTRTKAMEAAKTVITCTSNFEQLNQDFLDGKTERLF